MEGSSSRKRDFSDDSDGEKAPAPKRVRFPKGKKAKPGTEPLPVNANEERPKDWKDPRLAAKERARRRSQMTTELFTGENEENLGNISAAEVHYKENDPFVEDGIQIEPFNLEKEREEGYFDAEGNFVEYVNDKEVKDAWLDSIEVDPKLAQRVSMMKDVEDEQELSSDDIGRIKRRIANALEPGETVLQALRRLKGHSNSKKEKMLAETKLIFDQLTEDAMKLMENGDYNVYHEKQEVFEREAEGYERLAKAKKNGPSINGGLGPSSDGDAAYDMFADENENAAATQSFEVNNLASSGSHGTSSRIEEGNVNQDSGGSLAGQNDYVYDESSGYYYSSSFGYYYDPSSGLYCSASSGQWYSFNEETGMYDEVLGAAQNTSSS
ncbi:hypothetical protein Ancab_027985 [Ancistrocladus abbreviatus]